MRSAAWFVATVLAAACGGGSGSGSDASQAKSAPNGFTMEAIGDRSFASFGWSGLIHNLRVPDGTPFGVTATCDGPDGICSFTGPTEPNSPVERRRCLNKMSKVCSTDGECPADSTTFNKCAFIYDVPTATPLPGAAGKIGACGFSYIPIAAPGATPTILGTMDLTSGDLNITSLTILLLQNGGTGAYRGACAECVGDSIANDGVKAGHCVSALHGEAADVTPDLNQPCDVNRFGTIPGFEGNYSMDCSPSVRSGDSQNAFGGTFTSAGFEVSITANSPDCTAPEFAGQKCFCAMCPPPRQTTACSSNADCGGDQCGALTNCTAVQPMPFDDLGAPIMNRNPMAETEQCVSGTLSGGTPTTGFATAGNACRGGLCNWNPETGLGTCISKLLPNNTVVGCYPTGMGAKISVPSHKSKIGSVFIADTATARCTRQQPLAPVNGQLGLPGLTFQKRSFRIIPEYPQ